MERSLTMMSALRYPFERTPGCLADNSSIVNFEDHNFLHGFFKCNVRLPAEIPVCMLLVYKHLFLRNLNDTCSYSEQLHDQIIWPLYIPSTMTRYKNSSTEVFKALFNNNPEDYSSRFFSLQIFKGEKYYGLPGAIFDRNMNPIMVYTVILNSVKITEEDYITFNVDKAIIRVSPSVYEAQDVVSKAIRTKIIPAMSSSPSFKFNYYCMIGYGINRESRNPEIRIGDMSDIFCKVCTPPSLLTVDHDATAFLRNPDILEEVVSNL